MSCTLARVLVVTVTAVLMLAATSTVVAQRHFDTPEQAANRLVLALARADETALAELLGDDYAAVLPVAAIEASMVDRFLEAWAGFHALVPVDAKTRMLAVGQHGWSLPIPIVREVEGWGFDTLAGQALMRIRRVGRNELSAIQAALAYHDAQVEYAAEDHDGDGVLEYAKRFIGSPGTRDGLFWEARAGEPDSPLGALLAGRERGEGYHGYHYRILAAQHVASEHFNVNLRMGLYAPNRRIPIPTTGRVTRSTSMGRWRSTFRARADWPARASRASTTSR